MNLQSVILRFIARSSDSLVAFVIALDAKLDIFLAQNDDEIYALQTKVGEIVEDAAAEVARIRAAADEEIDAVAAQIDKAVEAAEVMKRLKSVLSK